MKVFIYRHAQAASGEPDEVRCLTPRGKLQVKALARAIPEGEFAEVSEIWHSPLTRAEETAALLKKYHRNAFRSVDLHLVHELEPHASVTEMASLLGRCEGDVVVVGHNPFLEELVTALCSGEPGLGMLTLRKGAMVCLERTVEGSKFLPWGLWSLQWYLVPRLFM